MSQSFPRTHAELDELAAAFSVDFPDEATLVDEKIRILQEAGVDPDADFVAYQLIELDVDSNDPDEIEAGQLNHVEVTVNGEPVRVEAGETFRTRDGRTIHALDLNPNVERVQAGESS